MAVEAERSDRHVMEVTNGLAAEFSGVIARPVVTRTVLEARDDLEGQIVPEALSEMLHQLARHRLGSLCSAGRATARCGF
ncbi:hypothetical protein SAMN05216188_1063 [Lentzea xinjiangensis]|uniref:Uncharacterized protein n=1 Tax=Lentzea xinjiangensis TaxID=402600 RepID=A0A1H9JIB0_9PSEU|nr:hypothetical protein [Lentzea xinjiangensis]SEQ86566.1 hypothetical protein SAMN05216188_1063 [Lentzea xinjiangensis]